MNQLAPKQQAHPATVAQEFMKRSDMKGGEVEAYAQTFNWLQSFLEGSTLSITKKEQDKLLEELKELREFKDAHPEEDLPVLEPEDVGLELDPVDLEASE